MKTSMILPGILLACCFAVYGQQGGNAINFSEGRYWACAEDKPASSIALGSVSTFSGINSHTECEKGWHLMSWTDKPQPKREPFDVAPQQWATYSQQVKKITVCDMGCVEIESPFGPREFEIVEHTHIGCADPRRALITTEDGVRHCYDLGRLENR